MLDWFKRKASTAPGEQPIESGIQTPATEDRVERLLDRLGTESKIGHEPRARVGRLPPLDDTASAEPRDQAFDAEYYRNSLSLFTEALVEGGGGPQDDVRTIAAKVIRSLREGHGITADHLAEMRPYLVQFVRDVRDGVVRFDAARELLPRTGDEAPAEPEAVLNEVAALRESDEETAVGPGAAWPEAGPLLGSGGVTVGEPAGGSPQMRIIAVVSQKGGVGKTTIAAHLAVRAGAVEQGPAVLIDTDPQGSLGEWWRARKNDVPALATVRLDELSANLAELRSYGTAVAIIDTPPALTASIEQVIAVADLIVIPARPSPHDLRAVGATVELVRKAGKPFVFVVNGAAPRASITAQAVAALSEHGRVVPVILYQRTDYAASMIDGRTVLETAASGRSAREISDLWRFIYEQIDMRVAA
jgi:chromosome partitioning protein